MTQPPAMTPNVAVLLTVAARRIREDLEAVLEREGLSLRYLSTLGHLHREPGSSYSELARRAGITAQSMHATLNELEKRGAVSKATASGRGRVSKHELTAAGRDLLSRGLLHAATVDDALLSMLTLQDRTDLARLLLLLLPTSKSRAEK